MGKPAHREILVEVLTQCHSPTQMGKPAHQEILVTMRAIGAVAAQGASEYAGQTERAGSG
eukprot:6026364-Alexandrium_andersonii.AAC.1